MFIVGVSVALGFILGIIVNSVILDNCRTKTRKKFCHSYGYIIWTLIFCSVIGTTSHLLVWRSMSLLMQEVHVSNNQSLYSFVMSQTDNAPITRLLGFASDLPIIGQSAEDLTSTLNQLGISEQELFQSIAQVKAEYSIGGNWVIGNSFTSWMEGTLDLAEQMRIFEYLP